MQSSVQGSKLQILSYSSVVNLIKNWQLSIFEGNGPSGIVLSYMLSGNWPYYTGQSQDDFLHARLMVDPHLSLVEQDLQFLSEVF